MTLVDIINLRLCYDCRQYTINNVMASKLLDRNTVPVPEPGLIVVLSCKATVSR